jgi:hypothetical protein
MLEDPSIVSNHHRFGTPTDNPLVITEKRKQQLTCTQKTARAKLEWLHTTNLIHDYQKTTMRHAMALRKAKGLISLLHVLCIFKHVISHHKLINRWRFASWSRRAKVSSQYWLISCMTTSSHLRPYSYHHNIRMLIILRLDLVNKHHLFLRVSWRFESIVNLARV